MILSDSDIGNRLESKSLVIKPFNTDNIQAASIDLTLSNNFLKLKDYSLANLTYKQAADYEKIIGDTIVIAAHSFILAATEEFLEIPTDLASIVEGRSSIGRMGLFIQNAGLITPGFKGNLTLELYNANNMPIILKAGMKICQIIFLQLSTPALKPYRGKYQYQKDATGSLLFEENSSSHAVDKTTALKEKKTILIASDHAGFALKQELTNYLSSKNIAFSDLGVDTAENKVDYPDYAKKVAKAISTDQARRGILICGTGIGMSIAANRFRNVRATLCDSALSASLSRKHNNSNILILAGRNFQKNKLEPIVDSWLNTDFEEGRHQKRLSKIEQTSSS